MPIKRVLQKIEQAIPSGPYTLRELLFWPWLASLDVVDAVTGRRDPLIPPRRMRFIGGGDFHAVGGEFLRHFIELGGLRPEQDVLDVGSGLGRMAVPLTTYLSPSAEYRGLEVVEIGVRWCRRAVTPRFPNFQFIQADVRNERYNPEGRFAACEYRFPFDDESFDFVFLTSVFTHMYPRDVAHYLDEIARVLRPGGTCFATFFILTDEARRLMTEDATRLNFRVAVDGAWITNQSNPEGAIAFDELSVRSMHADTGLEIIEPIHFGSWSGRRNSASFQDIVVSVRRPA